MQRLGFVDWARGFAVVAMVFWHTGDAWLRPALHSGEGFLFLRFIGGLAAPSFLLLAGLAAALAARPEHDPERRAALLWTRLARGFEVLLLGYALRLQTWLVDAAAIGQLHTLRVWLPLLLGYALLFWSVRAQHGRRLLLGAALGVLLALAGLYQVEAVAPGRLARLLQVDVLQAIGAALMLLALGERGVGFLQRPLLLVLTGAAVALATLPLASYLPGPLPVPLAAFLGRFAVAPSAPNPALFPLFPWFAYACLGACLGALLRRRPSASDLTLVAAVVVGASAAALSSEAHPFLQRWLTHAPLWVAPMRVIFRTGVVFVLLGVGFAFSALPGSDKIRDLGRASLRIYWIHLLFAYGILSRPVRSQLGYASWLGLASLLLVLMWGLSQIGRAPRPAAVRA